jgi:hypothetical protein
MSDKDFVLGEVVQRLGKGSFEELEHLLEVKNPILGLRNLVHKGGRTIQWDPKDEDLMLAVITIKALPSKTKISIKGSLLELLDK